MRVSTSRGAGLHGQMHVIAQDRIVVDGVDDVLDEIARVRGGEAHAADSVHFADRAQQSREIPAGGRRVAIAVDVLAQKLDFGVAHGREFARFLEDAGAGAAALGSARERDHAVGAAFVAAFDDGDVGAVGIVAAREGSFESFFGVEAQAGDAAVARFELHQHLRELGVAGRSGHQADVRGALEDALAFLLRDAAEDAEDFAFAVFLLELLQAVEDFLFGLVADAAGVVEDQVGLLGFFDLGVAFREQRADHFFGIVRVHLAAERLDVERLHVVELILL